MSLFGEVQLGYSRAVSDDEDDEYAIQKQDENLKRKVYWLTDDNQDMKLKVDELILADGPTACAFLHIYLLNHLNDKDMKLLGITATNSEYKVHQTNQSYSRPQSAANKIRNNFVYQLTNFNGKSFLICELFNQLKSDEFYDWIDQIWSKVEFNKTFILSSQNKSTYYGEESESFPLVKYMTSDKMMNRVVDNCKRLEEPNFLQNLPAALIQFCVLKHIEFTAFVCYSASLNVDLQSIKETYKAVLSLLREKNIFTDNELSKKSLLTIGNIVNSVSTLYM